MTINLNRIEVAKMYRIITLTLLFCTLGFPKIGLGNGAEPESKVLALTSVKLRSFCDSVMTQILNGPDSAFNQHLGALAIKDSRRVPMNGQTAIAFVVGCVGKGELLLLTKDSSGLAIPQGRIEFALPGLHANIDTVDLDGDGTVELRVNMTGGMGSSWSAFFAISNGGLKILRPAPNREAFYPGHGSVLTRDLDGDGVLEIIEYRPNAASSIYEMNHTNMQYTLSKDMSLD